jgi:predicted transcriptional regulator
LNELPKGFPEYSILFKTITNQIKKLEIEKNNASQEEIIRIQKRIQSYNHELEKIKEMFPHNFFI